MAVRPIDPKDLPGYDAVDAQRLHLDIIKTLRGKPSPFQVALIKELKDILDDDDCEERNRLLELAVLSPT